MAYKALNTGGLNQLNERFRKQALIVNRERGTNIESIEQERLAGIGQDVKEQLAQDMRVVQAYVQAHTQLVDGRVQMAQQAITTAKTKVAEFKQNPAQHQGTPQAVSSLIDTLNGYKTEIENDQLELQRAWSSYNNYVFLDVTAEYLRDFDKARQGVIEDLNDQKVKLKQIAAARRQVEAFKALADKIALKAADGVNQPNVRPLREAQIAGTTFSSDMRKHMDRVVGKEGKKLTAAFVTECANTLKANLTKQGFAARPANLTAAQALLKQAEQAHKTVEVNAKAAAKVFATTKKSFRASELKDRSIRAQVTYAQEYLDQINQAYKTSTADIARARKSMAAIEKLFR